MKRNIIISGLVGIFMFCLQEVYAKKFDLSGSGALSITQTNIDNKAIKDLPPDLTVGLEYMVNGRFKDLDMASSIELKFNHRDDEFDDEIIKSFTFGISNPRTALNLGDLYEDVSDFTLSDNVSMKFGLKLNQDIDFGEKTEVMLLGGRLQEASVYEIDNDRDGVLDEDEDLNGNGKWDYGYSYYDQWLGGIRLSSSPTKNTFLGTTYLKINDDKGSLEQRGTVTTLPIKNDVFGVDSVASFFNNFLTLAGELSRSRYEKVGSITDHDNAYKFSIKANRKKWDFEIGYNHIGTKYYSAGSPYLKADKKGYFATYQWLPNELVSITLEGEAFEDNLLKSPQYPVTDTKIITTTFEAKPKKYPHITFVCELTDELSDKFTSSYPKLDKFTKDVSLELNHSINDTDLALSLQHTNTNDKSTDTYGTAYEDYKSNLISFTLDTKFAQRFTLSNYISYTQNKTKDDKNDTVSSVIDLAYNLIPQKLIIKPGYEFDEYRVERKLKGKEFTAKMEVDYYISTTSQLTFIYEEKGNKNLEDTSTNYKADIGTIKYTMLF